MVLRKGGAHYGDGGRNARPLKRHHVHKSFKDVAIAIVARGLGDVVVVVEDGAFMEDRVLVGVHVLPIVDAIKSPSGEANDLAIRILKREDKPPSV